MSFVDSSFILFALVFFGLYFSLPRHSTWQRFVIFMAGIVMYGYYSKKYLVCLILIAIVDFKIGLLIDQAKVKTTKKKFLLISICLNLGLLLYTKYAHFFFQSYLELSGKGDISNPFSSEMPLGVSFYTFESISYVVDIYRGKLKPTKKWMNYGAFLSYFPHLVSGPIVRPKEFLTQLERKRSTHAWVVANGLKLILLGYFKKIVIADQFAPLADLVFSKQTTEPVQIVLGVFAFTIQIYTDFSAYTDIAQGLGQIIGVRLPENFNLPYISVGFRDFWRRWHISLSSWLRDYLYIPLGGSKNGMGRTLFALMMTMALGGLWHGANWTFLIWGIYHGLLLSIEHVLSRAKLLDLHRFQSTARWITFVLVLCGWVIFRATNLNEAQFVFLGLLHFMKQNVVYLAALLFIFILIDMTKVIEKTLRNQTVLFHAASLFAVLLFLIWSWQKIANPSLLALQWIHYVGAFCFCFGFVHPFLSKKFQFFGSNPWVNIGVSAFMICLILTSVVQARSQFIYFQF